MEDSPKPFWDHLEDLRSRLVKSLLAIIVCTVISYQMVDPILAFLARPVGRFVFLQPTEAFFVRLKIAFGVGIIFAAPIVLFQIWKFLVVALTPTEKASIFWVLPVSFLLFIMGISLGFFVLVPVGTKFLLGYSSEVLTANLSIDSYVNFVGAICLVLGAVFQMPLVSFFAAKMGFLNSAWLSERRRFAILTIYLLGALLTPGPDPVTALLLAAPSYLLFECSVLTARLAQKKGDGKVD